MLILYYLHLPESGLYAFATLNSLMKKIMCFATHGMRSKHDLCFQTHRLRKNYFYNSSSDKTTRQSSALNENSAFLSGINCTPWFF